MPMHPRKTHAAAASGKSKARSRRTRVSRKTRITIMLDNDVLAAFRKRAGNGGRGYQTEINDALRHMIHPEAAPLTVASLRRELRQAFQKAGG